MQENVVLDTGLAVLVGIGLAASCGFRVFVPLLVVSGAANVGYLDVAENVRWLASPIAMTAFAAASVVEIGAYYVPWLDNALDAIASPLSVAAGTILFAASVAGLDPFWQWSLAIIAGGGSAAVVQGGTVAGRLASTATTGGLANFVVNTVETVFGVAFSVLAIVVPVVAVVLLVVVVVAMYWVGRRVVGAVFGRGDTTK
ncbi:MAG: DUF4126 domain-containing protein [Pirellulales bacterium]